MNDSTNYQTITNPPPLQHIIGSAHSARVSPETSKPHGCRQDLLGEILNFLPRPGRRPAIFDTKVFKVFFHSSFAPFWR